MNLLAKTRWVGPNGHDITEDKSKRIHTESAGARLVIMNAVAQQDDGQYKCMLGSQGLGKWEEADFSLKTYKRPSFEGTEQRVLMQEDLAGQLVCKVEFDPAASGLSVTWSRQGTPIDEMHDSAYRVFEYDSSTMESKLLIKPVKRSHAGSYTCHAIAETLHLSRPFEQTIDLDVQFAPSFNATREIVWVERRQANNNLHQNNHRSQHQHQANGDNQQQATVMSTMHQSLTANKRRLLMTTTASPSSMGRQAAGTSPNGTVVLELNCVCDSNPPASIVWGSGSSRLALVKGTPSHVLEEPTLVKNGTQTQSVLLIEYQLDPNWEFKQEEYICSASNMIGQATKRFSIQQGDTSPAFAVAPTIQYNQATSLINFVILGPKTGSLAEAAASGDDRQPDVDAFRIRLDSHPHNSHNNHLNSNNNYNNNDAFQNQHTSQNSSPFNGNSNKAANSVILPLRTNPDTRDIIFPQNVTVSLASLPAGQHKLFLEAHNAVGWSRHRTELGDFKLVSNAANSLIASESHLQLMLVSIVCLTAFTFITSYHQQPSRQQL